MKRTIFTGADESKALNDRIKEAKAEIMKLNASISDVKKSKKNGDLPVAYKARRDAGHPDGLEVTSPIDIKSVRELIGHFDKVIGVDFSGLPNLFVSASLDGKLIVWDAMTTFKKRAVKLSSPFVACTCFEKSSNALIASGGMDNLCSIYEASLIDPGMPASLANKPKAVLSGHQGYISGCCFFQGPSKILTSSGDCSTNLWDVETARPLRTLKAHAAGVLAVAAAPDGDIFATGGVDSAVKVYDIRLKVPVTHSFNGHIADVNDISFFPDSQAIGTASSDATSRIFDLRAGLEMNQFDHDRITRGVTCCRFSKSGRFLFCGSEDGIGRV